MFVICLPQVSDSFCCTTWGVTTPRTRVGPTYVGVGNRSNRGAKGYSPRSEAYASKGLITGHGPSVIRAAGVGQTWVSCVS